jgi:hypothetical protein
MNVTDFHTQPDTDIPLLEELIPLRFHIGGYLYEGLRSPQDAARWTRNHLGVQSPPANILKIFTETDFLSHAMFALNHDREYLISAANKLNKMVEADRVSMETLFGVSTVCNQQLIESTAMCFPLGDKIMINTLGVVIGALPTKGDLASTTIAADYQGGRLAGFRVINCKPNTDEEQETEQL